LLTAVDGDAPSVELRLDLTSRRQDEGTAVGLQRSHTRGTSQREIMMRQSLLTLASSIPLPVPAVGLTLVRGTMIAVADEHGVTMYEVESPPLARAVSHHPAFGLRGVVPWAGGAVAWGSSGLHPIETELELPAGNPVDGAAGYANLLYVLRRGELVTLDRSGRQLAHIEAPGTYAIAAGGDMLALAGSNEVRFVDSRTLSNVGRIALAEPKALVRTRYAGTRAAFVVAVSHRGRVLQVAEYRNRQLRLDAVRAGRTFAAMSAGDRTVDLYTVGDTAARQMRGHVSAR
jgi:hypothetical protein